MWGENAMWGAASQGSSLDATLNPDLVCLQDMHQRMAEAEKVALHWMTKMGCLAWVARAVWP